MHVAASKAECIPLGVENPLRTAVMSKYMQLKSAVTHFIWSLQLAKGDINGKLESEHAYTYIYLTWVIYV